MTSESDALSGLTDKNGLKSCIDLPLNSLLSMTIVVFNLLLADQITVMGNKICLYTSKFANVSSPNKQIWVIFTLEFVDVCLWIAGGNLN